MKKIIVPLGVLLIGAGVGGGAAFGTRMVLGPQTAHAAEPPPPAPGVFVPATKVMAPLVTRDGRLAGYVSFDANLEVDTDKEADVTAKLPLLLHAINMRTYRAPLATGPEGLLPSIGTLRQIVQASAEEAFGHKVVRRVAISRAEPA